MTVRRILSALFAGVLLAGTVAASAEAAPRHVTHHRAARHHVAARHHAPRHAAVRHAPMHSNTRMARMAPRGGDAQNSVVDQLNAQSLQRAQTGAPAQ